MPSTCQTKDGVHTKASPFSTCYLILEDYQVVSQLFQTNFVSFSYLNSARHISVIELCHEPIFKYCTYIILLLIFLLFPNNVYFLIYLFKEITNFGYINQYS